MSIKRFEGTGRMSKVVEHNDTLYLCGQTSSKPDIKSQTKEVLEKIENLLEKYESDKHNILSVKVYLKDIEMFDEMNKVWDEWVDKGYEPARACVEAKLARKHLLVEMSVIAAKS